MKKKITSVILIIIMLLLPFGVLPNVNATIQVANNVHYNDAVTKSNDSSSFAVTDTADIIVENINADENNSDELKAYKIVDVFYNPTTNEMSYQFTQTFATFVGTLQQSEIRTITGDNNATSFTVDDYLDSTKITSDGYGEKMHNTASSLNKLVSKYATYIRTNNVTGISMTYGDFDSDNDPDDAKATGVEAGAYLVLPSSIVTLSQTNVLNYKYNYVYGVMVANVMYEASNGTWTLNDCQIYAKRDYSYMGMSFNPASVTEVIELMNGTVVISQEQMNRYEAAIGLSTAVESGGKISSVFQDVTSTVPVNIHSSINQNIIDMTKYTQVTLPAGFTFDYSDMAGEDFTPITKIGDNYYDYGTVTPSSETLRAVPIDSTTLNVYTHNGGAIVVTIQASDSYNFTAGAANLVKIRKYFIKDAYVDIGSDVTTAEVEAALAENLQNPTARQQQIQKAIGVIAQDAPVYIYGLRINNTNSSNTNLSGGVFQAYADAACTQPIGQPITMTNGTGSFVGVSGLEVVYLKQLTAPSGYRLFTDVIDLHFFNDQETAETGHIKETVSLGQDSYYEVTVVNQPVLSLPFTGGTGAIIYTIVGLVVVMGAIIFIVYYKKKNKKDK